ncbi:MAG: hypothetical protein IID32_08025 [Planctomycetes bacterium]|nr:hypothetical protein [Planctomycetota bacterium]
MSEVAGMSAGAVAPTSQISLSSGQNATSVQSSQNADFSSLQVSQSSVFSSSQTSSQTFEMSASRRDTMSDYNARMAALIMALINLLFGNKEDDENKKVGLLALLAFSSGGFNQSSSTLSISQSSSSSSISIQQTSFQMSQSSSNVSQVGASVDVSG